jgi:Glu-tRNA(Gln) amidotransferase subunit E-like FAD-binding protein
MNLADKLADALSQEESIEELQKYFQNTNADFESLKKRADSFTKKVRRQASLHISNIQEQKRKEAQEIVKNLIDSDKEALPFLQEQYASRGLTSASLFSKLEELSEEEVSKIVEEGKMLELLEKDLIDIDEKS